MNKSWCLIALVLFVSNTCFSQNTFDIVFPKNDRDVICQQYVEMFKQKPKEVWLSVESQGNELYFEINDKTWFDKLFKGEKDGLAVDVVSKDIYGCYEIIIGDPEIKGELLKPIFAPKLKSGLQSVGNLFRVHVGNIPSAYANKELEFNILFLNNNNFCRYYWIYQLESYNWDLLDMGMYLDSLTYNPKEIKRSKI